MCAQGGGRQEFMREFRWDDFFKVKICQNAEDSTVFTLFTSKWIIKIDF